MKRLIHTVGWILFLVYVFCLIDVVFLGRTGFTNYGFAVFSKEHLEYMCNFVPFKTVVLYYTGWKNGTLARIAFLNLAGNFGLFAPMALFLPGLFPKKMCSFGCFFLSILLMVISVEAIQFFTFTGSTDIDDVILNVSGAVIAFWCLRLFGLYKWFQKEK